MPRQAIIRTCVVALAHGQHDAVGPSQLKRLVVDAAGTYDVIEKGRVYGDSPDEWSPFRDGESILHYLNEAGFAVTSLSSHVGASNDIEKRNALLTEVDLYVIDPLYMALEEESNDRLLAQIEAAICQGRKGFCIPIPNRLPTQLRDQIMDICACKLRLLKHAYDEEGRGEWVAESPDRLMAYLRRVRKELEDRAPQAGIEMMRNLLISLGAQYFEMDRAPKMLNLDTR